MTTIVTFYFMSRKEYTTNNTGNLGLTFFLSFYSIAHFYVKRVATERERKEMLSEAVNLIPGILGT